MMRKLCLFLMVLAALLALTVCAQEEPVEAPFPALRVSNGLLMDDEAHPVALRGMSSHGLGWYPRYINAAAMQTLKEYGANVIRLALYSETRAGYLEEPYSLDMLYIGIENAIAEDMYVIVDWHILSDGNPKKYEKQAVSLWRRMAKKYKNHSNVIYEICNEPNGGTSWKTVKSYATKVIKEIRRYDKNAVILVGTPNWSQNVDEAAKDPLDKKYRKNFRKRNRYCR